MTICCKDVWESGAGRIDYVWHVGGMPWAACNTDKLRTYLETLRNTSGTPGEAITHWFGAEASSGLFVNFLSCLDERNTQWAWSFDEAAGLSGGDHQIQLAEVDPGINWATLFAVADDSPGVYINNATGIVSSSVWGIPGVSQIYDVSNDDGIYYAEIKSTAQATDTEIVVRDVRGFGTWLAGIGDVDYALIWIGHEAIGVTSFNDDGDGLYTLTCERGLLRTRPQAHVSPEYSALGEYVSTAPLGGIVGRPSCLWAFPSDDDGATYGRPTLLLHGKVSQGIRIRDGVATIRVLGPLDWLKAPSATRDYQGHLTGFVLQRGNIGTEPSSAYGPASWTGNLNSTYLRAPHIIIYERYSDSLPYAKENWANIWLCQKEESVVFWSIEELINAIQSELDKCSAGSGASFEDQLSGDDTTDNPRQVLKHQYKVTRHGISRVDNSTDNGFWIIFDELGTDFKEATAESMIGGPIPTIFGLSLPFSVYPGFQKNPITGDDELYSTFFTTEKNTLLRHSVASAMAMGIDTFHSWGKYRSFVAGSAGSGPMGYMQFVPPADMLEDCWQRSAMMVPIEPRTDESFLDTVEKAWFPRYFYEFSFDNEADWAENGGIWAKDSWAIPYSGGGHLLYLEPNDGGIPVPGVAMQLGGAGFGPRLECTIDSSGETAGVWYVDIAATSLYGKLPGTYGASSPDGYAVFTPVTNYPCLAWIPIKPEDPWSVSQGSMASTNKSASELLTGALGFGATPLAPSQALGWVPEVGGGDDGYGWIDFAIDYEPITADERYVYSAGDQSFLDTFMSFLRCHGMVPYLELMKEANYDLWVMRFRKLGISSISDAYSYNRRINDNVLLLNTSTERDVGSGHLYSSVDLKMNYEQGEPLLSLQISDKSAYAQNGYARKTWTIDDRMTICPSLSEAGSNKDAQAAIASRFVTGILRHISRPRAATNADGVCRALARLPVGAAALATDAYARHPWTGARGYSDMPATVTKLSLELGSMKMRIGWTLSHASAKGWAPALYCPVGSLYEDDSEAHPYRYRIALDTYSANVAAHEFSGSNEMNDLARFDCLDYDEFTGTYSARGCSCGDYNITVHEPDNPSGTIYTGTISVLTDGTTAVMDLNDSLSTSGDESSVEYIIQFGAYSTSQPCQRALYVGFVDVDGYCGDGTSSDRWQ